MLVSVSCALLASGWVALACESCYGPQNNVIHTRNVRRMQPGAQNATVGPRGPLEWGQINFLHTTDTRKCCQSHTRLPPLVRSILTSDSPDGFLEGHLKEQNYGADWGDFVSFTKHMRHKAGNLGVDLLLVDTGELSKQPRGS